MAELEIRKGAIDPSSCVSEGWELIKPNYLLFFGMTFVMLLISFLISLIPYIGEIINIFISGPLLCGIYMALIAKTRGGEPNFSMLFEGFSRFLPAVLLTLIGMIPWLIIALTVFLFSSVSANPQVAENLQTPDLSAVFAQFTPFLIVSYLIAFLVSLAIQILLFFALPLVAEHNLNVVDAVKLSISAAMGNIGGIIVLIIFEILLALVGFLALCIGFLFVMPVIYAANIIAYKSVFPSNQQTRYDGPPRPDSYGFNYGAPQE
jgi:hypothetical protein